MTKYKPPNLKKFIYLSFPLVVSQITDNMMFFMDRIFLAKYGDHGSLYLNAALTGGLTMYVTTLFFISIVAYTSTLIAQNYGAGKTQNCASFVTQGIFLSFAFTPIILLVTLFYRPLFQIFNHDPLQFELEVSYSTILVYGGILSMLRSAAVGFFSGIGETKTVMVVQLIGMLVNIPLNYTLIFGVGPFPELGIEGAAIATIIGFALMDIIFYTIYFSNKWHAKFNTRNFQFDYTKIKQIIRYGFPTGVQMTMGIGVFTYFILVMNSYGPAIGTAVTIAINWDSMFFIPMMGMGFATSVLVGQALGAKSVDGARKVLKMSLGVMSTYAILIGICLLTFTHQLVEPYLTGLEAGLNYKEVYDFSVLLLKLVAIYLLADVVQLALEGLLRGAGDTNAVMFIQISIHITFGLLIYFLAFNKIVAPLTTWWIFVGFAISLSIGLTIRYHTGKWKTLDLVSPEPANH